MQISTTLGAMWDLREGLWTLSQSTAAILMTSVWQSLVLAGGLAVSLKLAPRTSARLRFAIWMTGFVAMIALPFLPMLTSAPTPNGAHSFATLHADVSHPWLTLDARWSLAIAGLWLAASLYRAADLAIHIVRLRALWKNAVPAEQTGYATSHLKVTRWFGLKRGVELCTTTRLEKPGVIGFLAPRILIPEWLMERLTAAELDQIVLHETEHLRRGDDWTNLLQKFALVIFPLNPGMFWVERQLCLEREMACDEGVIRRTHAPRAYAACLTSLAERGLEHRAGAVSLGTLSLGAWHRRPELVRRVHTILLGGSGLGPWATRGLLTAMGCGLLLGSVELARAPQMIGFATFQPAIQAKVDEVPMHPAVARTSATAMPEQKSLTTTRAVSVKSVAKRTRFSATNLQASAEEEIWQIATLAPQQQLTRAIQSDSSEPQEQRWILLTTWEQQTNPDSAYQQSDSVLGDKAMRTQSSTVMLRVVPKSFVFPALAAVPTRSGWYILQM